jgi:hypothetical protein
MRRKLVGIVFAGLVGTVSPLIGGAFVAAEASCVPATGGANPYWTTDPASYSDTFNASIDCNGIWALQAFSAPTLVKGQYYISPSWQDSSLSAKWVYTTKGSIDGTSSVVGQTVDGRRVRGHALSGTYDYIYYRY